MKHGGIIDVFPIVGKADGDDVGEVNPFVPWQVSCTSPKYSPHWPRHIVDINGFVVAEGKADAEAELDTVADDEAVADEEEEGVAEADTVGMVHPVLLGLLLLP